MKLPFAESWKIKMVEPIRKSTREEREQWIKEAHYNVFQLKSEQVYIDLITDSGTGAMSDRQWAGMMLGDESYAGATSFFKLKEMITKLTGFEYIIPTHQGRAAENVLFSYLVHEGDIVPGNSHFDTTKGHIEGRHAIALDCTVDAAKQTQLEIPFKGNVDPDKLQKALTEYAERIPFIIVTITNNTAGGHAIFIDAPKVLTHVPREEFPAQTLTIELYLEAGIRGCEIGYILADRDPVTHENRFNGLDLLRLAIPRRVYTDNHMNVIAAALKNVYERRESITHGVRIAWEAPLMRHFTVQLERL